MYDMYPDWTGTEWGPAKHDPDHPFRALHPHEEPQRPLGAAAAAIQDAYGAPRRAPLGFGDGAFAQRDADDQRPDDN